MKKIVCMFLAVVLLAGCTKTVTKEDYETKINDLETQIETLTQKVEELNETVAALTDKLRDGNSYQILKGTETNGTTALTIVSIHSTVAFSGSLPDRLETLYNLTLDEFGIYYHDSGEFEPIVRFKALNQNELDLTGEYAGATIVADLGNGRVLIALVNSSSNLSESAKTYLNEENVATRFAANKFTVKPIVTTP